MTLKWINSMSVAYYLIDWSQRTRSNWKFQSPRGTQDHLDLPDEITGHPVISSLGMYVFSCDRLERQREAMLCVQWVAVTSRKNWYSHSRFPSQSYNLSRWMILDLRERYCRQESLGWLKHTSPFSNLFSQKAKNPLCHLSCTTGSVRGKVVSLYCVSSWIGFVHLGPKRGLVQTSCWLFSGHSANLDQSPVRALNQSHTNDYDASWRTFHWLLFKHFHIAWLVVHASKTCSNPLMHTVPGGVCGRILLGSPSYPRSSQRSWGINGDRRARKMPNWSDLKGKPCNSWYRSVGDCNTFNKGHIIHYNG